MGVGGKWSFLPLDYKRIIPNTVRIVIYRIFSFVFTILNYPLNKNTIYIQLLVLFPKTGDGIYFR